MINQRLYLNFWLQDCGLMSQPNSYLWLRKIKSYKIYCVRCRRKLKCCLSAGDQQLTSLFVIADIPSSTTWAFLEKYKGGCYFVTPLCFSIFDPITFYLSPSLNDHITSRVLGHGINETRPLPKHLPSNNASWHFQSLERKVQPCGYH